MLSSTPRQGVERCLRKQEGMRHNCDHLNLGGVGSGVRTIFFNNMLGPTPACITAQPSTASRPTPALHHGPPQHCITAHPPQHIFYLFFFIHLNFESTTHHIIIFFWRGVSIIFLKLRPSSRPPATPCNIHILGVDVEELSGRKEGQAQHEAAHRRELAWGSRARGAQTAGT